MLERCFSPMFSKKLSRSQQDNKKLRRYVCEGGWTGEGVDHKFCGGDGK